METNFVACHVSQQGVLRCGWYKWLGVVGRSHLYDALGMCWIVSRLVLLQCSIEAIYSHLFSSRGDGIMHGKSL